MPDRPLKSALKSPWSPCDVDLPPQSVFSPECHSRGRQRSKSAPNRPTHLGGDPIQSTAESITPPASPKAVHFPSPDEENLASVRFFKKSGRPVSVSRPSEETDTETDGESSASSVNIRYQASAGLMGPFHPGRQSRFVAITRSNRNRTFDTVFPTEKSNLSGPPITNESDPPEYELDTASSSTVPSALFDPTANIHLESVQCRNSVDEKGISTALVGTILVRNVAYEKDVSVRFTLDDWVTTSNVSATYTASLPALPLSFLRAVHGTATTGDCAALLAVATNRDPWDRFTFTIELAPFATNLPSHTLWLVARYSAGHGEWWDNNGGENYRFAFVVKQPPINVAPLVTVPVDREFTSSQSTLQLPHRLATRKQIANSPLPPRAPPSFTSYSFQIMQPRFLPSPTLDATFKTFLSKTPRSRASRLERSSIKFTSA
ncbi:protein phosphatase regulator [Coprinopsis cinerea AmutBmut pab1-1]|nr:protein phosphatase regulator [Coprinopsis cinerea AmutBmut pab1-1]